MHQTRMRPRSPHKQRLTQRGVRPDCSDSLLPSMLGVRPHYRLR